mgnify:CR=1 FL=1
MTKLINLYEKAEKEYAKFLQNYVSDTLNVFFPLELKFSRPKKNDEREVIKQKLEYVEENSKQKLGFGYYIKWKQTAQSRTKGEITLIDKIYFENVDDYLKFIKKQDDFFFLKNSIKK